MKSIKRMMVTVLCTSTIFPVVVRAETYHFGEGQSSMTAGKPARHNASPTKPAKTPKQKKHRTPATVDSSRP